MKLYRLIPVLIFITICYDFASAQMERTMYQVFGVDSAKTVALDIVGHVVRIRGDQRAQGIFAPFGYFHGSLFDW